MEIPAALRRRISRSTYQRRPIIIRPAYPAMDSSSPGLLDLSSVLSEADRKKGLCLAPVTLGSCTGGCFDMEHPASNMLQPNSHVYCSEVPRNFSAVFNTTAERTPMTLTHVVVTAPSRGYTSPVQDGAVFLVQHEDATFVAEDYHNMTKEQFDELWARKERNKESWEEGEPIGFFSIPDGCSEPVVTPLKVHAPSRQVLVHFIRPQPSGGENMDVQFVGFKGHYGSALFSTATVM